MKAITGIPSNALNAVGILLDAENVGVVERLLTTPSLKNESMRNLLEVWRQSTNRSPFLCFAAFPGRREAPLVGGAMGTWEEALHEFAHINDEINAFASKQYLDYSMIWMAFVTKPRYDFFSTLIATLQDTEGSA